MNDPTDSWSFLAKLMAASDSVSISNSGQQRSAGQILRCREKVLL